MLYRWTRDLHLYGGLFLSPFLLVFAVSVFFLNHGKVAMGQSTSVESIQNVEVPVDIDRVQGQEAIAAGQTIMRQVGVDGEIGFTRFVRQTGLFTFPVSKPGMEVTIDVDVRARAARVSRRQTSLWERVAYLHKMPGPHNVAIRGNWPPTNAWKTVADLTVYLTLFITISGICLWWTMRRERRAGVVLLSAGFLTVVGCVVVLFH